MKKCIIALGLLALTLVAKADTGFLKTLPPEDLAAAGLQKLTPEELTRLEALVQRYKSGIVSDERQQAEAKALASRQEAERKIAAAEASALASRQEAERKVVIAEAKAKEAETKASEAALKAGEGGAKTAASPAKKQPGWFTALLTLNRASDKPEKEEPLEGRLVGKFEGWNGHTIFTLEDGTRWVQQNKTESYVYAPALRSPKVKIRPAAFRGFWLEVEGVNLNVRVVPLEWIERK